jgi:hypothetical protein
MSAQEICFLPAHELVDHILTKKLSAVEVMEAHLSQIDRINPTVNAIVTLLPEQAMAQAKAADEALAKGQQTGPLHGLPIAHKDLILTKGIRTTSGSPIFKDFVPVEDALIVERLKNAGTITIGKTNTPEFGAGSQTFNEVFGETLNPYDTTRTCGGSSGGAADRRRQRHGRFSAKSGQLLQRCRHANFSRQGAELAEACRLVFFVRRRPNGPHGERYGTDAKCDCRTRPAFAHRHCRRRPPVFAQFGTQF